jgi:peptidoglycan lytic transglycosylase G
MKRARGAPPQDKNGANGVRQRDRESMTDSDPHGLLFDSIDDSAGFFDDDHTGELPRVQRVTRSERRAEHGHLAARRRNTRVFAILGVLIVAVLLVATWLVVLPIYHYLHPSDYSGGGSGTVIVEIQANDTADDIGTELHDQGVVASVKAFTDAAKDDPRSQNIQPGSYRLREHMSAKSALALLLDPSSRVNADVVVTEGATEQDVLNRLTAKPCGDNAPKSAVCGPGMDPAAVRKALQDVKALGLPTDYLADGSTPKSVEGFLYPATYYFAENTDPADALQQMITEFTDAVRRTNFTTAAQANHITPYEQLIIASIAQSEAKYPEDYGKVARVILNRLASNRPLQVDATSSYACKLAGTAPSKCIYAQVPGPYNTYDHDGLPPTPVGNPGADAMAGAASPDKGDWLYYVNKDAAGHLFFTDSEAAFERAVHECVIHNWGCG